MTEKYLVLCFDEEKNALAFDHNSLDDAMFVYDVLKTNKNYAQVDLVKVLESSRVGE